MEINISQRLLDVASFVPKESRLLDVGSDHAYLPMHLIKIGWITFAVAGEVVEGPYHSAVTNVQQSGLSNQITVRLADGLSAFSEEDKITCITISGMGGRLISDILEAGKGKLSQIERLVLQPNNCEDELRLWLMENHFKIVSEKIMMESGKFYEIIVAEQGQMILSDHQRRFGPFLSQEKSDVFLARWQRDLNKLEVALAKIPLENETDRFAIKMKINLIKEAIISEG